LAPKCINRPLYVYLQINAIAQCWWFEVKDTEANSTLKATVDAHLGPGKIARSVVELDPASAPVSLNVDHIPATQQQ